MSKLDEFNAYIKSKTSGPVCRPGEDPFAESSEPAAPANPLMPKPPDNASAAGNTAFRSPPPNPPAPLPPDEQALLNVSGPDALKVYQQGKARRADRQHQVEEAHRAYKSTGQIPQTKDSFAWIEIKEGRLMDQAERMDAMLKKQGKPYPQMDAIGKGEVDPEYLTIGEFKDEVLKRANVEKDKCEDDHWFRGPTNKCKEGVNDKYGGEGFKEWDKAESQRKLREIQAVADRIEDVKNAGPVKLAGKAIGRGVGYVAGGDEGAEKGDEIGGMVGGLGDAGLAVKAGADAKARTRDYKGSAGLEVRRDAPVTTSVNKPPTAGMGPKSDGVPEELVKIPTKKGTVEMTKIKAAVEENNARKWLQEQKAADSKKPEKERRTDAKLIEQARDKFNIDRGWEPFGQEERQITVQTPRGPEKMTVAQYRQRVQEAEKWVNTERTRTTGGHQRSEADLHREAAGRFGLDDSWADVTNPNYHGSRIPPAPPKGEPVSPQAVRQMRHHGTEVIQSPSSAAHQQAWKALGHQDNAPVAYIVDNKIHVDMTHWPQGLSLEWDPSGGRR